MDFMNQNLPWKDTGKHRPCVLINTVCVFPMFEAMFGLESAATTEFAQTLNKWSLFFLSSLTRRNLKTAFMQQSYSLSETMIPGECAILICRSTCISWCWMGVPLLRCLAFCSNTQQICLHYTNNTLKPNLHVSKYRTFFPSWLPRK